MSDRSNVRVSNVTPDDFREWLINEQAFMNDDMISADQLHDLRDEWESNPIGGHTLGDLLDAIDVSEDEESLPLLIDTSDGPVYVSDWRITSYNGQRIVALNWRQ